MSCLRPALGPALAGMVLAVLSHPDVAARLVAVLGTPPRRGIALGRLVELSLHHLALAGTGLAIVGALGVGLGILALASLQWLLPYLLQTERSYVGGVVVGHYGDWYFREKAGSRLESLQENLTRFLPWTIFLPAAFWWWWRDRDPRRRLLVVWTLVIAVAVSLSSEQRARYFLPVLPPLSLLIAELLARARGSDPDASDQG